MATCEGSGEGFFIARDSEESQEELELLKANMIYEPVELEEMDQIMEDEYANLEDKILQAKQRVQMMKHKMDMYRGSDPHVVKKLNREMMKWAWSSINRQQTHAELIRVAEMCYGGVRYYN